MRRSAILPILILALALRLVHLTAPIIGYHAWRQADTAAMARNYHENGYRFFYPQIDFGGTGPGYVECELPLYSWTVSLLYGALGFGEQWARLLSAVCSLAAIWAVYRLARRFCTEATALWAAFFLAILPLNIYYGRAVMPESAMLAASALGLLAFSRWTETGRRRHWLAALVCVALAALLKIPALYLGLPLLYLAWLRFGNRWWRQPGLWLFALLVLLLVAAWYWHSHRLLLRYGLTFGVWEYGVDKWGNWDLVLTWDFWNGIFLRVIAERYLTWAGLPLLVVGLLLPRHRSGERLFDFWLLAVVIFFLIVQRGNYVHEYYQLPFLLPAAVFLGKVFGRHFRPCGGRPLVTVSLGVLLAGVLILGGDLWLRYLRSEDASGSPHLRLAALVQARTPVGSRLVTFDVGDPALLYLSHRKGWHAWPEDLAPGRLAELAAAGADHAAGLRVMFPDADLERELTELDRAGHRLLYLDEELFLLALAHPDPPDRDQLPPGKTRP